MAIVPNYSVLHQVPIMRQPQTWACWYTAFQMVVAYERGRGGDAGLKDPSEVAWIKSIYDGNKGIGSTKDEREKVAKALGFETLFASVSVEGIWDMLRSAAAHLCRPLARRQLWPFRRHRRNVRTRGGDQQSGRAAWSSVAATRRRAMASADRRAAARSTSLLTPLSPGPRLALQTAKAWLRSLEISMPRRADAAGSGRRLAFGRQLVEARLMPAHGRPRRATAQAGRAA